MAIILFDNQQRNGLYPLTQTRAIAGLRMGILTIAERWALRTGGDIFIHTTEYLQPLYPRAAAGDHLWIDAAVLPDDELMDAIAGLTEGCCLADETGLIAGKPGLGAAAFDSTVSLQRFRDIRDYRCVRRLQYPWQMVQWNDDFLREDFQLITAGRVSQKISPTNRLIEPGSIFIEAGAQVEHCIINAATGPVYIGKDALVMEGTAIRGPLAVGAGSLIKMNSRIYGATTLGPFCLAGGEIKNSILTGYSNKAHDGYLGDSVLGEWCNLGAGTTNSNVKNTAGEVKAWSPLANGFLPAGLKCGVFMGDYSRTAINSSVNTGSVIGVSCHVFGEGLLPKRIGDFSWGTAGSRYEPEKAVQDIANWKKMKGHTLSAAEASVIQYIFAHQSF